MSMDYWEAEREAAYDEFVESLSKELYAEHAEQAIDDFVKERLRSYYESNPTVAVNPTKFARKAKELISTDPTTSLLYSSVATEVFIKAAIVKSIISVLVHSEAADLIAEQMVRQSGIDRFSELLFTISREYAGIEPKDLKREGSNKSLWEERGEIQKVRNTIVHQAKDCEEVHAKLSFDVALHVFWVTKELIEELGFEFDGDRNILSRSKENASNNYSQQEKHSTVAPCFPLL